MRYGIMSAEGAKRVGVDTNTPVRYVLHPKNDKVAMDIYSVIDGTFIGNYVSVGEDGIIDEVALSKCVK